jgi:hypothetical protein
MVKEGSAREATEHLIGSIDRLEYLAPPGPGSTRPCSCLLDLTRMLSAFLWTLFILLVPVRFAIVCPLELHWKSEAP